MMAVLQRTLDFTAQCALYSGFLPLLEKFGDRNARLLRVLTYHRVDELSAQPDLYPNLISATPAEFEWQVGYLARHCRVVSLAEVVAAVLHGQSLPSRSVLITFDDGYRDFAEHAWPILRRFDLPVTVFIPTAFPDQPRASFWWDRLYSAVRAVDAGAVATPAGRIEWGDPVRRQVAFRRIVAQVKSLPDEDAQQLVRDICAALGGGLSLHNPTLDWSELRGLAAEGVTLAPHTRRHPLLNRVSLERAREEIAGSLADLRSQVGSVPPVLAYPSGAYSRAVVELLPELGFQLAFTTCRGLNDLNHIDRFRIRRMNIGRRTSPALLRTQLLPWTVHLNRYARVPESMA